MLSFATEFPIENTHKSAVFVDAVRMWILESPHTTFVPEDFIGIPSAGGWAQRRGNQQVDILSVSSGNDEAVGVRFVTLDRQLEWVTTIIFSRKGSSSWVGIRTARESSRPAIRLPPAKKPVVVRTLLEMLGGGQDGGLPVGKLPHMFAESEVALAARLISGKATCHLPIVYVSCGFDGQYDIDLNALAHDLSGMAHVVVEPSRRFSRRLQPLVASENVYGGTIGVYWPGGGGRRSFFLGREYEGGADLKRAVVEEIRTALTNRRPMPRCTWAAVQEIDSRLAYDALRQSGSNEVAKYIEVFDAEMKAKDERLRDADAEIDRLEAEIREHESRATAGRFVMLEKGAERDFYLREISDIVLDALADAVNHVQRDSRREHVLKAIIAANVISGEGKRQRDSLKDILRGYRSMSSSVEKGLKSLGFSIEKDGKHHKLTFHDDDRYCFALATTSSDVRGGLNTASDIGKRTF